MVDSYNCLRLDNKRVFNVEVYEDNDKQKFFEVSNNKKVPFEKLKVGQLAELISCKGKFEVSDISNLWKVDVDKSKLNTEDDIRELGGMSMEFEYDFISYFQDDYKLSRNKIHIVVVIATTSAGKCLSTFYLSNKKFTVIKYRVWSDVIIFFLSTRNTFVVSFLFLYNQHKRL